MSSKQGMGTRSAVTMPKTSCTGERVHLAKITKSHRATRKSWED